jgi:hypothetical protein
MKKFVAPLQAFALLLLCSGMAWMVFVLASVNPAPPTAMDIQARNTQDLSFSNMNSTAVALAKQMLANVAPTPAGLLFLPVTGKETATPGPAVAMTLKAVSTIFETPTPLPYLYQPTATRERNKVDVTPTRTPAPTRTMVPPTATQISAPTKTKLPTQTPVTPTKQPIDTPTDLPTSEPPPTSIPQPTSTVVPPDPPTAVPPEPTQAATEPPTSAAP